MIEVFTSDLMEIHEKINEVAPVLEQLPGVVVVNSISDGSALYMNKKGLESIGVTLGELQKLGANYHDMFFNPELAKDYVPQILGIVSRNDPSETVTIFQQVKYAASKEWQWHITAIRLFIQEESGNPLALLCISHHLASENHYAGKVQRLTDELTFIKENIKTFNSLGKREKEILKLMAQGKSTQEIAAILFISTFTADTHRKNIRRKLGIENSAHLLQFAQAFDLI